MDNLYVLLHEHVKHNNQRPNCLMIHPRDVEKLRNEADKQFGYYAQSNGNGKIEFQGIKFIRSLDIEENNPIFVK